MMNYTPEDIYDALHEHRMLVFIEAEPLSNKYRQAYLTVNQYKKITKVIMPDDKPFKVSEKKYTLPDLMSIHETISTKK